MAIRPTLSLSFPNSLAEDAVSLVRPRARLGCGQYRLLQNKDQKASDLTEEEGRPTDDI